MSDKVGKQVWTTSGVLKTGVVFEHHLDPEFFKVLDESGKIDVISIYDIHFTQESVRKACEESSDYWAHKAKEMEQ